MPTHALSASARLFVFLSLTCFILTGCPARKPISSTSTSPAFHLKPDTGSSLLLSPNIPAQQPLSTSVSFKLAANSNAPTAANACLITKGMFRVERDSIDSDFRVVLPPPHRWLSGNGGLDEIDIIDQLYSFLDAVDKSERAGCFTTTNGQTRDSILQNIPTRPSDSLFNAYGYRIERSGVNLKPNLRLKVERAYFSTGERSDKNYLGVSTVLFDVTANPDGSLRFQQAQQIRYNPESLSQTDHEGSRDLAVLDLKPQNHYRVLFYTHQVPTDQNFSAAIIGSDDSTRLDEFEQSMRANAGASCSSSAHDDVQCMEFRGFATVTVQIPVELNGQSKFVDWGTEVKYIVPDKSIKSLKIHRQFLGSYFELNFPRADPSIKDLALIANDRLTW
jgi:hypothetical protein